MREIRRRGLRELPLRAPFALTLEDLGEPMSQCPTHGDPRSLGGRGRGRASEWGTRAWGIQLQGPKVTRASAPSKDRGVREEGRYQIGALGWRVRT